MFWNQQTLKLQPFSQGLHLITRQVEAALPQLARIRVGMLHVFIRHTSASLTINEKADRDVRADLESFLSRIAPEDFPYHHTCEGRDDMPAHIKAALLGSSVTIPVAHGSLCLGTWQGVYLCEHRRHADGRELVLTLWGEAMDGDGGKRTHA